MPIVDTFHLPRPAYDLELPIVAVTTKGEFYLHLNFGIDEHKSPNLIMITDFGAKDRVFWVNPDHLIYIGPRT